MMMGNNVAYVIFLWYNGSRNNFLMYGETKGNMNIDNENRQKRLRDQLEICELVRHFCAQQRVELEQMHSFLSMQGHTKQQVVEMHQSLLILQNMHRDLKQLQQEYRRQSMLLEK